MRYKIKKETKPTLPTFGKYKAVAVHNQTVDSKVIATAAAKGQDQKRRRHHDLTNQWAPPLPNNEIYKRARCHSGRFFLALQRFLKTTKKRLIIFG